MTEPFQYTSTLADKYQVSRSLIGLIVNRKIWKHLK